MNPWGYGRPTIYLLKKQTNKPHVSGPTQFQPMLLKGQLYFRKIMKFLGRIWNPDENVWGVRKLIQYHFLPIPRLKASQKAQPGQIQKAMPRSHCGQLHPAPNGQAQVHESKELKVQGK